VKKRAPSEKIQEREVNGGSKLPPHELLFKNMFDFADGGPQIAHVDTENGDTLK
jgi:hypothetical protein